MYAITTMLKPSIIEQLHSPWQLLGLECLTSGITLAPFPHFSWLGCGDARIDSALDVLEKLAITSKEFTVRTSGFGVFTGTKPVLYLPIIKDQNLLSVHRELWHALAQIVEKPNIYYSPENWIPHITLVLDNLDDELLGCAVRPLVSVNIDLEINVDHFELDYFDGENLGAIKRYPFSQSNTMGNEN